MNATLRLSADVPRGTIHRNVYGHFAEHLGRCIYEGIWVGENSAIPNVRGIRKDVVAALRDLAIPVLRWPGGCFADDYHWRDGIGPKEARPSMINTHWGGVVENNHFGTHEFYDLCEQLGTSPYICGNVGSGTVAEMRDWVEYCTFPGQSPRTLERARNGRAQPWALPYFGVGNENWGCGGNMTAERYAEEYRRYATYVRKLGPQRIERIACGPNNADWHWTEVLMREVFAAKPNLIDGLSLHYYTVPRAWEKKGPATGFEADAWHETLRKAHHIGELLRRHGAIMDHYDPGRKVNLVVDEWGTWYDVESGTNPGFLYQQNSIRDALVAAVHFHHFQDHPERVRMANIAQTVNVLQAMVLTDGARMLLTPTYHVFRMFKVHHDATALSMAVETPDLAWNDQKYPALTASASRDASGKIHLSLSNASLDTTAKVRCLVRGAAVTRATGEVLAAEAMDAHNTFDRPEAVKPMPLTNMTLKEGVLELELPPKAVAVVELA